MFKEHAIRARTQYAEVRRLKENLYPGHSVVIMDFSENFVCDYLEEVQSSYYNKPSVSLHPVVIYFKDETDGSLKHKSYIYCSDDTDHKAAAIFTIMRKLNEDLNVDLPLIDTLHYVSDSPTSQYRNKTLFQVVAHHQTLFGKKATWTYMEAGHGKGASDGVGGSSKRLADVAIKRGIKIQNAEDYVMWGNSEETAIKYVLYNTCEIEISCKELEVFSQQPVSGTMQLHACVPIVGTSSVALCSVSCFCSECYTPSGLTQKPCPGWRVHEFRETQFIIILQEPECLPSYEKDLEHLKQSPSQGYEDFNPG